MALSLRIGLEDGIWTIPEIWKAIEPVFADVFGIDLLYLNHEPIALHDIELQLVATRANRAVVFVDEKYGVMIARNRQSSLMNISFINFAKPSVALEHALQMHFSTKLVSASLYDAEFVRWQDTKEVSYYEDEGRPHSHLSKRDNGVPYPHNRMEIDISQNPGRTVHRHGYTEAVGSTMWLGPSFAARTGGDWTQLKQYDWCQIEQQGDIVRIQSWPTPFDSDQGEQRVRQEVLRRVLFPKSLEPSED